MSSSHSAVREGAVAGAIGATILAGWYFVVDVAHGQPFRTPLLIAQLLFGGVGSDAGSMGAIVVVTIVHFLAIMLVGVGLVALVHIAARELEWRMALIIAMAIALGLLGLIWRVWLLRVRRGRCLFWRRGFMRGIG